ncbi:catecholate siderophore receptor fiu [Shigella sonnei]|nr:catecholate siderophore receptor fiu [Shigella sonnei]
MENNRNFPARQFHSLTFFAGLCIGITPVAQALAAEGQTNADDTLVVEASTPSLYAPQRLKIRAQPTLPTRSKTPPAWVMPIS